MDIWNILSIKAYTVTSYWIQDFTFIYVDDEFGFGILWCTSHPKADTNCFFFLPTGSLGLARFCTMSSLLIGYSIFV